MLQSNPAGIELRIIRLEEANYFIEEKLKALDQQLLAQQQKIDQLEKDIISLGKSLAQMHDLLDSRSLADNTKETLPPHWQSTFWHEK